MSDPICLDTGSRVVICPEIPAGGTHDTGAVEPRESTPEERSADAADSSDRLRSLTGAPRVGTRLPMPARGALADDLFVRTSRGEFHVPGYRVDPARFGGIADGTEIREAGATRTLDRSFTLVRVTDTAHPERSGLYLVPSGTHVGVIRAHAGNVTVVPGA
ncbi:MAG TPA: hypothetical protein VFX30_07115 [bacterium]|nr:hypothetical protein [bacterium]